MGTIAHDSITAAASERDRERIIAFRNGLPDRWRTLLVGPVPPLVNGYEFWAFLPDGSKEWWSTSDEGDRYRTEFADLLDEIRADFAYVRFGGDFGIEHGAAVIRES